MCWNINGWKNNGLPVRVLQKYNPHIFIIVETHMGPNDIIEATNYKAIMHNRVDTHIKLNVIMVAFVFY